MRKRKVVFLSLPSGIFGNGGQSWLSVDLNPTRALLEAKGFTIEEASIDRIDGIELASTDVVIYTSCEAREVREYMKDAFYFLRNRCLLVPEYEFLLAYENKGFQELKKRALGIGNLSGEYHYDIDSVERELPYVFKTIDGAGSSGVHLVRSLADEKRVRRKYFNIPLKRKLIMKQRKRVLSRKQFSAYRYRHKGFKRYVAQNFVRGADHDYKILVFGERYFCLKRNVRKNDFRASGSGDFDFSSRPPKALLSFASEIALRLDAPQLSLDIVASRDGFHLIEYQALNFGPTTLTLSEGHYVRDIEGDWQWRAGASDLGDCFAHSIDDYLTRHGIGSELYESPDDCFRG